MIEIKRTRSSSKRKARTVATKKDINCLLLTICEEQLITKCDMDVFSRDQVKALVGLQTLVCPFYKLYVCVYYYARRR